MLQTPYFITLFRRTVKENSLRQQSQTFLQYGPVKSCLMHESNQCKVVTAKWYAVSTSSRSKWPYNEHHSRDQITKRNIQRGLFSDSGINKALLQETF